MISTKILNRQKVVNPLFYRLQIKRDNTRVGFNLESFI